MNVGGSAFIVWVWIGIWGLCKLCVFPSLSLSFRKLLLIWRTKYFHHKPVNIHLTFIYFIISESNIICPCLFKVADKPLDITWTSNFGIFEWWNELAATKPNQTKVRTPICTGWMWFLSPVQLGDGMKNNFGSISVILLKQLLCQVDLRE